MSTIPEKIGILMNDVKWLDEPERRAWRGLQFMQMRLDVELARQLATDSGLSYPDYMVLVALTDDPQGRLRQFELGELLGWEKSRVSHHLGRMAGRGLVERERCDSDRRGAYVSVTPAGRSEIEQAAPGHVAAVRRLFIDLLSPKELEVIAGVAERVLARINAETE
jgi:DNA-binding MarR family transcriptional regulator